MPTGPEGGRIVLDTSAYSWLRAGDPNVLDAVAAADVVIVPVIVLGELEAAFEGGTRAADNRASLAELVAEPWIDVQDVTPAIARRYGRVFSRLRKAGTPIPLNDVWIAATSLERAARLITFDAHFDVVEGLSVKILNPGSHW